MNRMRDIVIKIGICSLLLLFIACKKDEKSSTLLEGVWELRQIRGNLTLSYEPGNGSLIKFTGNSYEITSNGQTRSSGIYEIVTDLTAETECGISIPSGYYTRRIIYDDSTDQKIFFEISGDKLTFLSGYIPTDGGGFTEYARK